MSEGYVNKYVYKNGNNEITFTQAGSDNKYFGSDGNDYELINKGDGNLMYSVEPPLVSYQVIDKYYGGRKSRRRRVKKSRGGKSKRRGRKTRGRK